MNEIKPTKCEVIGNMLKSEGNLHVRGIGKIYKLTSPSGKIYIGQTIQPINRRWNDYRTCKCKDQPKLFHAIKKYGFSNFSASVIEICDPSILNDRETHWITHYNSVNEGYNCTHGGEHPIFSAESIEKIRASAIKFWKTDTRARVECSNASKRGWTSQRHKSHARNLQSLWKDPTYRENQTQKRIGKKWTEKQTTDAKSRMLGVNPKMSDYTEAERAIISSIHRRQEYTDDDKKLLKNLRLAAKTRISKVKPPSGSRPDPHDLVARYDTPTA
jgi:group I intron endonuclease